MSNSEKAILFKHPELSDGPGVYSLVDVCKPLDLNSRYLYLLQCSHFRSSCVTAWLGSELVGWVSGYPINDSSSEQNNVFFVWQVAVGPQARGQRLGARMIEWLLARQQGVQKIHTSITPDNEASWGLFKSLAKSWGAELTSKDWFESDRHFAGHHETERLVEIQLPKPASPVNPIEE